MKCKIKKLLVAIIAILVVIAAAVIFAIWITKSAVPLWTFLIPAMVDRLD